MPEFPTPSKHETIDWLAINALTHRLDDLLVKLAFKKIGVEPPNDGRKNKEKVVDPEWEMGLISTVNLLAGQLRLPEPGPVRFGDLPADDVEGSMYIPEARALLAVAKALLQSAKLAPMLPVPGTFQSPQPKPPSPE